MNKKEIQEILEKNKTVPRKKLGQHFLICPWVTSKMLEVSKITSKDFVLEIGPGLGILTKELGKKARHVIAIEKDKKMVNILRESLKDFKNITIIEKDILRTDLSDLELPKGYKVVANLPYNIASIIIRRLLESNTFPKEVIIMVQKEVAERIVINKKKIKNSILSIATSFYADSKIIKNVPCSCFWPQPKVISTILKITPHNKFKEKGEGYKEEFFKILKIGFSHPRKQLVNNLSIGLKLNKGEIISWLEKYNIDPSQRASTLALRDWINLAEYGIIKNSIN